MIFDWNRCCAPAALQELQGKAALAFGPGLWAGILSSGECTLDAAHGAPLLGHSGDLVLGMGPFTLRPVTECHMLAVCLTGLVAEDFAHGLSGVRFVNSRVCPGAAERIALLADGSRSGAAASETAYALLCELSRADEAAEELPPLAAAAVEAIRNNYMGLYGVEELSRQLGVSKCHLVRVFTAALGISPGRFLIKTRVESAKLLLEQREYNLEMIATLCGFSGANYLCRVFKKETGVTPSVWRDSVLPREVPRRVLPQENEMYV